MGSCGNASGGAAGAATGSDVNTAADSDIHVSCLCPCIGNSSRRAGRENFQISLPTRRGNCRRIIDRRAEPFKSFEAATNEAKVDSAITHKVLTVVHLLYALNAYTYVKACH